MEIIIPAQDTKCILCGESNRKPIMLIPHNSEKATIQAEAAHVDCLSLRYMQTGDLTYIFMIYPTPNQFTAVEASEFQEEDHEH